MFALKARKVQTNAASIVGKKQTRAVPKVGSAPARSTAAPQPNGRADTLFANGDGRARTEAPRQGGPRTSRDFGSIAVGAPMSPANVPSGSERVADDLARLRVRSEPEPTKLPAAPEPQKGEKPLGTLKDKVTGAEEKIYASFVPAGLWWFNGGSPTLAPQYPSSIAISLASLGKGDFALKVTAGSDKAALAGGGAALTGKDLDKFTIETIGPSKKHKDVTIEIKHRAPGAKSETSRDLILEVSAPDHLKLLGTDHRPAGKFGYLSLTSLQVFDNFGDAMPYIDVNEDFGTATLEAGVSSEWKDGFAARTKGKDITRGNAVFQDQYRVEPSAAPPASMIPQPSNPTSPLGKTKAGSFPHDWYVGSDTTGKGVLVSHHTGVFYTDHAEYTGFTSPPAAAKAPAGKKP
jgi:hypothetical protein